MPCHKEKYSYRRAREIINDTAKHHSQGKKKIPRREYFCEECQAWHVTSMTYWKGGFDS
jgi:hypothetical protein